MTIEPEFVGIEEPPLIMSVDIELSPSEVQCGVMINEQYYELVNGGPSINLMISHSEAIGKKKHWLRREIQRLNRKVSVQCESKKQLK